MLIIMDNKLKALWAVCKEKADSSSFPEPKIGSFYDEENFSTLQNIRHNLCKEMEEKQITKNIRKKLKKYSPSKIYDELVTQEERRTPGQFWTPKPVARRMISFSDSTESIFDVGVGTGTFLKEAFDKGFEKFFGIEKSPILLDIARYELRNIEKDIKLIWGDFLLTENLPKADFWISNPPYTRHHSIGSKFKSKYQSIFEKKGFNFSRAVSLFFYFFANFLSNKEKWDKASFICPRSLLDSRKSKFLKQKIKETKLLDGIEIFENQKIFNNVITGPAIYYLNSEKEKIFLRNCQFEENDISEGKEKLISYQSLDLESSWTNLLKGSLPEEGIPFGDLFEIKRGIATGKNSYFVLTQEEKEKYNLPDSVLEPVLAKTRYCQELKFTKKDWKDLKNEGREVYLLYLSRNLDHPKVEEYIELGREKEVNKGSLVQTRPNWYEMEKREDPEFLITYLSRDIPRFILNKANVVPLNVFHCAKARVDLPEELIQNIWKFLNSSAARNQTEILGRNYGEDTVKIEPRELDRLIIPYDIVPEEWAKERLYKSSNRN